MDIPNTAARNRAAVFFMIGASALISGTSLLAKALGLPMGEVAGLHPFQVTAGRFWFGLVTLLVFLGARPALRPGFAGANWGLHMARVACGWLGVTSMFAAVAAMPVAEATAISFLAPLVTMALAVLMLGERLGLTKLAAAALALVGVTLILKPGTAAFQVAGLYALASAGFLGVEAIFIKRLSGSEPALRVLLMSNLLGSVVSLGVVAFVWAWPVAGQWALMALLGAVMVGAQACFVQALKRGEASLVMPVFYTVLVFAAVYDYALYDVVPDLLAGMGAALIVAGALLLAFRQPVRAALTRWRGRRDLRG
ncbi:DMT family transporter [Pseudoponticoccus marisrubri]|uniref:EamA domain-containing protein n=1 Tax=Pseudoponticoccus marisrubri TaxID=1685382 RepID=A0A0W7WFE7_9RHOB|nr:DMT family transporter [Pseudoponticoccus marisrubri]KUF09236.1 hypothetical protein AVJ23_18440 [Pseudoponticoccus marisrubri]